MIDNPLPLNKLVSAYVNWCNHFAIKDESGKERHKRMQQFERWVGSELLWGHAGNLSPEVIRKIELLAGPHHHTIMKMLEARNEIPDWK